ncbi:FemAB family PEP-CTERM system-associated protein [Proteobacteria bacterium 005FR1]|nr:FemAB family PEP-CTERM system-associated protein [Proteobacteria bacterium 005FR1]
MDVRAVIQDPQAAIVDTWGSVRACPAADEVNRLSEEIAQLKTKIKQTKAEKGRIAGRFKEVKGDAEKTADLKQQMASISKQLSQQEKERKNLEKQLAAYFEEEGEQQRPDFPERFTASHDLAKPIEVTIEQVNDADAADWDRYVDSHPRASFYHRYAWRKVIKSAFGHDSRYYAARDAHGKLCGTLSLVALRSRLFGNYAVSMPFFNYGGAIADNKQIADQLYRTANADAQSQGWEHVEYRSCEKGYSMPNASRKVSMILALPESEQALNDGVRAKVRAQCNQANKYHPEIRFGGRELLDDYYQVFSRNMRDLGTPVYSRDFFDIILKTFPKDCTIVCAYIDGKPAGAAFLAGYKDMLEIPWASTLREYNECNVNMWMYREILQHAIREGYPYFDFGRSTEGAGTYNFKKQWGAKPVQHYWYYYLAGQETGDEDGSIPEMNPDNPKYKLAIAAWKRLPVVVANVLGPRIVKNLP